MHAELSRKNIYKTIFNKPACNMYYPIYCNLHCIHYEQSNGTVHSYCKFDWKSLFYFKPFGQLSCQEPIPCVLDCHHH